MPGQSVSSAVATREAGPVTTMFKSRPQFAAVLPKSVDVDSFLGTMAGALYASKDLMQAAIQSPDSLYTALMRCAALGHQPGTDEFYLTPRKRGGRLTVLGIEGYRGIIERMYRSGAVKKVVVREVCAKDKFKFVEGRDDKPYHVFGGGDGSVEDTGAAFFGKEGRRDRGMMVGVYAYAELTTGAISRVVILSRDDIMAVRDASDSAGSDFSPWNRLDGGKDHPEFKGRSMWWKTAARRLEPWVPTSAEYRREMMRAVNAAAEVGGVSVSEAAVDELVVDGEIVEDGPAAGQAGQGAAEPDSVSSEVTGEAAPLSVVPDGAHGPSGTRTSDGHADNRPATATQVTNLKARLAKFSDDAGDQAALLQWLRGKDPAEQVTRGDCAIVDHYIVVKRAEAEETQTDVAVLVWAEYRQAVGGSD